MSAPLGEWLLLMATALAAAGVLAGPRSWQAPARVATLVLAGILVAVHYRDATQFVELRDEPALAVALVLAGAGLVWALAIGFRRWQLALPIAITATLALRVPVELGGESANLLLPLYLVIVAATLARVLGWVGIDRERPAGPVRTTAFLDGRAVTWARRALAAVLVLYAIQAAYGSGFSLAAENAGFFFAPFTVMLAILAELRWDRRTVAAAFAVVVAEMLLFALVALGQYLARDLWWNAKVVEGNQYHEWFRVNSLFWDPNIYGRFMAIAVTFIAAALAYSADRRRAWAALALGLAGIGALGLSFSQSSLLALLAGLVTLLAVRWGVRKTAAAVAACVALVAAAAVISGPPDLGAERLEEETTGRVGLLRGGLELAEDEPIVGHGAGSFAPSYRERYGGGRNVAVSSHSEPVTVGAEQGFVGLLVFGAFVVLAGLALVPARGHDSVLPRAAVLAGFAVMVVHSGAYAAFLTDPITWALLGTGFALARMPEG